MRVLLVEDDRMIGEAIVLALRDAAYAVDWVTDGSTALSTLEIGEHEIVLLDLGLPRKDGLEVLRQARQRKNSIPIVIITARDSVEDRVAGLDLGADDYLVKPFDIQELKARMRAVIRRRGDESSPLLTHGHLTVNPATHEATFRGTECQLSAREFALLQALLARPGTILSRAELEQRIYGWNEEVESNAVEFIIHSVRKKFGQDIIKNVRGVGWTVGRSET